MSLDAAMSDKDLLAESERRLAARGTVSPIVRQPAQKPARAIKAPKAVPSVDLAQLKFYGLLKLAGLPEPITEHRFAPPRRWRFDYAFLFDRVAVEVEGGAWTRGRHTRGAGFIGDLEKYSEAAALGWRLIRVTPDQLATPETVDLIRRALAFRA